MLRIDSISRSFGGLRALHDVSFTAEAGQICALIGPNGAGKTTLINIASGLLRPTSGRVWLDERDLVGEPPHRIAAAGVARTFQNIRLFGELSAIENVLVGDHLRRRDTLLQALFGLPAARRAEREARERAYELLERMGIGRLAELPAATLSYGDQRRVEIARALALRPKALLLDEPAAGMNAAEREQLVERLVHLRSSGLILLIIEHDMELVMRISDQVVALNFGSLIAAGRPETVRRDPQVVAAYLGDDGDHEADVAGA
jgi:ABC-type branched-subunit amino acid transport system ATPase component